MPKTKTNNNAANNNGKKSNGNNATAANVFGMPGNNNKPPQGQQVKPLGQAQAQAQAPAQAPAQAQAQAQAKPQGQGQAQAQPQGPAQAQAQSQAHAQVKKQKKAAAHDEDGNSRKNDRNANARKDNAPVRYKALIEFFKFCTSNKEMMDGVKGSSMYAVACLCPLVSKHVECSKDLKKFCDEAGKVFEPLICEKTLFLVPQHATVEDVYACLSTMHMSHSPNANTPTTYNDVGGGKVRKQLIQRFDQVFQDAGDKPRDFITYEINGKKK